MTKNIYLVGKQFLSTIALIVMTFSSAQAQLPTIAVVDFEDSRDTQGTQLGRELAEFTIDSIVNTGLFTVVEREKMDTIFREIGFTSKGGAFKAESAVQLGELLGAQYLLTGKILGADHNKSQASAYEVTTTTVSYNLKASIRVIDTATASIVFSARETENRSTSHVGDASGDPGAFTALTEQLADKLISKLVSSPRFQPGAIKRNTPNQGIQRVEVHFETNPPTADIEIDGTWFGNSGKLFVPSGKHIVTVSLAGYSVWEKTIDLQEGSLFKITLSKE